MKTKLKTTTLEKITLQAHGKLLIKVDAQAVHVVQHFVSKEVTRYYLNGVAFQSHPAGGVVCVATDGSTLAAYYDPDGQMVGHGERSIILPITTGIKTALKAVKSGYFIHHGNLSHVTTTALDDKDPRNITENHVASQHNKIIDGTYPDWRRTVPKEAKACDGVGINLALLKRFKEALGGKASAVRLFMVDGMSPVIVRSADHPNFLGLCMPMRVDSVKKHLPEWYDNG